MASYEKNQDMPGPDLQPMSPNWDELYGKWNEKLFMLFMAYCEETGKAMGSEQMRTNTISMKCSWITFSDSKI